MHSVTKYINGHSDVIMGALLTNDTLLYDQLYKIQKYRGATPSAFDCFLVLRSLATLELRFCYLHTSFHHKSLYDSYMTDLFTECSNTWRVDLRWPHFCHHILMLPMSFILSYLIILNIKLLWINTKEDTQVTFYIIRWNIHINIWPPGMVAFELSSTMAAQKFISLLKVVKGAASLGSSHSLVCQPAKLTHVMCTKQVDKSLLPELQFVTFYCHC